jgi:hypothetical protein
VNDASARSDSSTATGNSPPVISIDSAHRIINSHGSRIPYIAAAGREILVQPNRYPFTQSRLGADMPNVLRVLYDKSEYAIDFKDDAHPLILNAATLRVVKGNAFQQFEPGTQAYIGVGIESTDPRTGAMRFQELWVASVLFH